jgi:hypothetical protein
MTQHPYDELERFALGELDASATDAVLQHADRCPTCAALLADSMRGVAALANVAKPREAAAPLLFAQRRHRSRWLAGLATAAAVLLGAWNVELQATRPEVPIDLLVHSHFAHHPLTGSKGSAKIIQALDGSWVYLVADGLRPLGRYELTIDGTAQGGVTADLSGRASGYWQRPASKIDRAALQGPDGESLLWTGK